MSAHPHSPGPLFAVPETDPALILDVNGQLYQVVRVTGAAVGGGRIDRLASDLQLFATAPELLAELKTAVEALEWYAQERNNAVAQDALVSAKAAIAKAEGR